MTDTKYNGWTNYATWRVNLEIFDGFDVEDYYSNLDQDDAHGLGQSLRDYAEQVIFECGECNPNTLAGSYAMAFLDDVNWYEIAKHMLEEITA
jgi:hypothetical protein